MIDKIHNWEKVCIFGVIFASLVTFETSLNTVSLYFVIPVCFILSLVKNISEIKTNKTLKFIFFLFLWLLFTSIFTENSEATGRQLRQILGVFLFCYIFSEVGNNFKTIPCLYFAFFTLFFSAIYYAYNNIYMVVDLTSERLNDEHLNANTLAYYVFFFTFLIYIFDYFNFSKKVHLCFRWLFFLMIVVIFTIALLTASRQILVVTVPFWLVLLFCRYLKKTPRSIILTVIFVIGFIMLYATFFADIYDNSMLAQRSEVSAKDDVRYELLVSAIHVGLENPIVGVGPGCYVFHSPERNFSHNSYSELFACTGFVGMLLLVVLYYNCIITQWKRYKELKESIFLIFFIFMVTYSVYNFFYVFYLDVWLLSFFALVSKHSDTLYKRLVSQTDKHYS